MVAGYGLSVMVLLLICVMLQVSIGSSITNLTQEQESLDQELARLKDRTKEVRDLEKKRSELSQKLALIAVLKKNKLGPVRIMDDLNVAIPERAWITEIKESSSEMKILGLALDNQTIALFMKDLEASDYFLSVDLEETKQVEMKGINLQSFVLNAKISYSGQLLPQASAQTEPTPVG